MADTNQNHGGALRLAVSPSHLVFSEILSVTSAMRKNSRWASSQPGPTRGTGLASTMGLRPQQNVSVKSGRAVHDRQETILLWDFEKLKRSIRDNEDIMSLPLTTILSPFLALIRSPLSTGPITSTALASIQAFFTAGLITPNSPNVEPALIDLSNALAHCKFEASDSSSDEVVLLRILTIINSCLASAVGETVGDVEVCEMLETVLTICCQMRLSETLRKNAENTMGALGRHVFSRLDSLRPEDDTEDAEASKPYGLPSVQELLRVLVNLLDPTDQQHTDSIRLTALGILQAALEFSGSRIGLFPSLADMILDQGCKFLLQLARSDNTSILHLSLRVLSVVFHTMRGQLKLQTELFLSFAIDRLAPPVIVIPPKVQLSLNSGARRKNVSLPGTPTVGSTSSVSGDPSMDPLLLDDQGNEEDTPPPSKPRVPPARGLTRELLLETLGNLARQPSFMVDLWVNYDCDASCEDLFDRLVQFMTRGVYPTQYVGGLETQRYASQLLCLDSVLSYVHHMNARAEGPVGDWPDSNPQPDALNLQKSTKRLILTGASRFNTKPKTGFAYFEEHGLIYKKEYEDQGLTRPEILAMFLKNTPRLDKKVLGDWISAPENIEVLRAFIKLLDFKGKSIADAMRVLVEAFRLPGEAAPIGRVTETFAEIYFATKPPEIKSTDAVYVLAYSVILLNTDLYNPQNRKRMTIEDYKRNLRGVNDGEDFDPDYLQGVYDSIKKREIIMPEEHTGQLGFEYAWKALLLRTKAAGPLLPCNTNLFDRSMFQSSWKPVLAAITYAFTTFDDDYVVDKAIAGLRQCANLAGQFDLPEVFDYIVSSLSRVTGLLTEPEHKSAKFSTVQHEGQSITVSPLSIKFGTNVRGQLAAVVLFAITNGNGNAIREGWSMIFEMFETLFFHSLLPPRMLQMEDFLGGASMIPMQGSAPLTSPNVGRSDGGLLSALSSYLLTPYGASTDSLPAEPTSDDIENTLSTMDCITSCKLDELYSQLMNLELEPLTAAVRAIQALADRRTVTLLDAPAAQEGTSPISPRFDAQFMEQLPYDPVSVFLLEIMTSIALHAKEHIEEIWPIVFEHISGLLNSAQRFSILLIERAVVALLRLCLIITEKPPLRDQIYVAVDLLRGLPPDITTAVGEQVVAGLGRMVQDHKQVIRSATEWGLVFALIRGTISHPEAAKASFSLLSGLINTDDGQAVTGDNINGLISLLDDFAGAAGAAVEGTLQQQRRPAAPVNEPTIERGVGAVELVADLRKLVPRLMSSSTLPIAQAWETYWVPVLTSLARQSTNTCRDVRHSAINHLQRILLSPQLTTGLDGQSDWDCATIFTKVLCPLTDELLNTQTIKKDVAGMSETRLRASTLLCKSFLHYSVSDQGMSDLNEVWIRILDQLDQLMKSGQGDQLYEAIPESLKNVVLVMNASDVLVPPSHPDTRTASQVQMWNLTKDRMDKFLPGFLDDLIPTPPPPPAETTTQADGSQPPAS